MDNHNRQIEAYLTERDLKHHERRMFEIMHEKLGEFSGDLLDIGCASGKYLELLHERYADASLMGIELNQELVDIANKRVGQNIVVQADIIEFVPPRQFDAIIASGVITIFEDQIAVLEKWLSWLKPGGTLFIFSQFNTRPIDTLVYYRSRKKFNGWETGLSSFSIDTFAEYLDRISATYEFEKFHLPIQLPETDDPIRSFTVETDQGERMIIYGANIISDQHFLTITTQK